MADATSTIRVNIIGDAKSLQAATATAEKSLGGFGGVAKGIGAGIVAGFATDALLDFTGTALAEGDRLGDAITRLESQIGTGLTRALVDASEGFADIGLSAQDVLDLESAFADTATAMGVTDDQIASLAPKLAEAAGKIALISDSTPDEVIANIGKAAAGGEKALKALGVDLSDAEVAARAMRDTGKDVPQLLTDSEKAAAAYQLVLEKLAPKIDAVSDANGDLEQTQAEVNARIETLTGKVGAAIDGPLNDFLGWILSGVDGLMMMSKWLGTVGVKVDDLIDLLLRLNPLTGPLMLIGEVTGSNGPSSVSRGNGSSSPNPDRAPTTIVVQQTNKDDLERSVVSAIRDYDSRNGTTFIR